MEIDRPGTTPVGSVVDADRGATREALEAFRTDLYDMAQRFFDRSNEKKRPQWERKAHAHAFAGILNASHLFEEHFGDGAGTRPTGSGTK